MKSYFTKLTTRFSAFTAIELIGVLAIMSIVATALVPSVIRKIDRATWQRETSDLSVMANGLKMTILKDKVISTNFVTSIAKYLDLSTNQVLATSRGFARLFMVDPKFKVGSISPYQLPYVQTNNASLINPTTNRVMIISTIANPPVTTITDTFDTVWNLPVGSKPPSYGGRAEDLCIQRIDVGSMFHKVYLLNVDTNFDGFYAIEPSPFSNSSFLGPNGKELLTYVLDGTVLSLYMNEGSSLELRSMIKQDESFVYQKNQWARKLSAETLNFGLTPGSFGDVVNQFLMGPPPPDPKFKATRQSVINSFYAYFINYWNYADANWEEHTNGPQGQSPFFKLLQDSQCELQNSTYYLIH